MSAAQRAMHAGEAVAEALRAEGVERVYSVPGSHIHPIYDGLSRVATIRLITCKQEPSTSLMADAYARLTGRVGVCLVTAGPGCLNSMAGVAQAYGAASPVVHLSGAVPLAAELEAFHGVDDPAFVHEMFKKITKWSARVERLEDIPGTMAKAFCIARSGRPGPVHVELPRLADYSEYILQEQPAALPAYRPLPAILAEPEPDVVERVARGLMQAHRPVIAAGKGILRRGALAELVALAERLQAPVVCAQDAIGAIPEAHPLFAGHFGYQRSHPLCRVALEASDLLLAVGLRAGAAELSHLRAQAPEKPLVLVGFDDAADSRYREPDEFVADPKRFLVALIARLDGASRPPDETLLRALAEGKAALRRSLATQIAAHRTERPIHPGVLMEALDSVLEKDAVLASDVGNCQMWARTLRRIETAESFLQSGVWNAMSFALPTAIVAKMEFPARQVVALAGDGALLMTLGELPTAVEHGANILVVVLNDGAFGQTYLQQMGLYGHSYGTTFCSPCFAEIARACGAEGVRVEDPSELEPALRRTLDATRERPALLEVMVARSPYARLS